MTINIQREALNCITRGATAPLNLHHAESYLPLESNPSQESGESQPLDKRLAVDNEPVDDVTDESSYPELDLTDDDSSVSSYSISSTSSRRVTFREELVTEVWLRPRTLRRDIRDLFYSYEETQQFRQEYRQERKRAAQDAETSSVSVPDSTRPGESQSPLGNYRISHVVVKRGDSQETFVNQEYDRYFDLGLFTSEASPSAANGSSTRSSARHHPSATATATADTNHTPLNPPATVNFKMANDDFFDNDNFWSGQITWY